MINVPDIIKDLYHLDHCYKNIRIHFPNGERSDICNDLIVKDSVSFKESLCSQSTLKFGLCESPVFECETVGVGNIKGATIEVSCEIECPSEVTGAEWKVDLQKYVYSIPYGTFVVTEAKRQADMIHRRIIAYNRISLFDWKIGGAEKAKAGIMFRDQADYTPELVYCLGASGVRFSDEIFDLTEYSFSSSLSTSIYYYSDYVPGRGGIEIQLRLGYVSEEWGISAGSPINNMEKDVLYRSVAQYDYDAANEVISYFMKNAPKTSNYYEALDYIEKRKYFRQLAVFYSNGGYSTDPTVDEDWKRSRYYATYDCEFYLYPYMDDNYYTINASYSAEVSMRVPNVLRYRKYRLNGSGVRTLEVEKEADLLVSASLTKLKLKNDFNYLSARLAFPRVLSSVYSTILAKYGFFIDFDAIDMLEYTTAFLELRGVLGFFSRSDLVPINIKRRFGLTPDASLYPGLNVYPEAVTGGRLLPQDCASCWYDDEYSAPIGYVTCKYKDANNNETDYAYYFADYTEEGNFVGYDLSNNYFIKDLSWTKAQLDAICAVFEANVSRVSYMPVDFKGRGLPYVEAGDTFEILTKSNDSITTIVLNRTIKGEQTLEDSYSSV